MIQIKKGVSLNGLVPQMSVALQAADVAFQMYAGAACVITSANDSKHMAGSLHYQGKALDFRVRHLADNSEHTVAKRITRKIAEALGDEYDVIFEGDHIHVEYDPPRRTPLPSEVA